MAQKDTVQRRVKKYLFDQNNFDDDYVPEPEAPPPPVFSEQELEAARSEAYGKGRREALAEAAASREKHVADLLEKIGGSFSRLFEAEAARAAQYEAEIIHLTQIILARMFPALNARHGLDEIKSVLESVLQGQKGQPEILIEVHPDYTDTVKSHIEEVIKELHAGALCTVRANAALGPGDCRMGWHNGGAVRDSGRMALEVEQKLEQILADKPRLRDNGEDNPAPADT